MTIPRDLSGDQLIRRLAQCGYAPSRQSGNHVILTSTLRGHQGHVAVSLHRSLRIGTVAAFAANIADYLDRLRDEVRREIFP